MQTRPFVRRSFMDGISITDNGPSYGVNPEWILEQINDAVTTTKIESLLSTFITATEDAISSLGTDFETLETTISGIESEIETLTTALSTLSDSAEKVSNSQTVNLVVERHSLAIAAFISRIISLLSKLRVGSFDTLRQEEQVSLKQCHLLFRKIV